MSLTPCPHCARHVRAPATACPFCGAVVALSPRAKVALPRLGRAALFAASTTLAACGSSSPPPEERADEGGTGGESTDPSTPGPGEESPGGVVALYGAPAPDEQGPPPSEVEPDPGAPVAAYGGPMPPEGPQPR